MKGIVFTGDRRVEVRDFADPEPGAGEVVVRMKASGVCGSDLHLYRKSAADRAGDDTIPGHEPCGVVERLGHGVGTVKVGDRVTVYHWLGCGHCIRCLGGDIMHCPDRRGYGGAIHGSHGDLLLTNAVNCLPLPDDLSFADGAIMACGAGTAFSSLTKLSVSGRDTLVVFGQGPVGLNGLLLAKALGARVIALEPADERRDLSHRLGADAALDPHGGDVVAGVLHLTGGQGADATFETSGSEAGRRAAIECLRLRGRAAFVGINPQNPGEESFDDIAGLLISRQLTLMGSFVMPIQMYPGLVSLVQRRGVALDSMVTHRFAIEDAAEALQTADTCQCGKVIFEWP